MKTRMIKQMQCKFDRRMRQRFYRGLALLTLLICLFAKSAIAIVPTLSVFDPAARHPIDRLYSQTNDSQINLSPTNAQSWIEQSKRLYESGQFAEAAAVLQQAIESYQQQGEVFWQAVAWSNLSLTYQQIGQWDEATRAIETSLELLTTLDTAGDQLLTLAQVYDVQARLQLAQGQAETALETWQQTADLYEQTNHTEGLVRSSINQAEAMQRLGLYRRAVDKLRQVIAALPEPAASTPEDLTLHVVAHRSLGNALRLTGDLDRAETELRTSLTLAQPLQPEAIAATQLSLANVLAQTGFAEEALELYEQAAAAGSAATRLQAQLNQLRLFTDARQTAEAQALIPDLMQQLDRQPANQTSIDAQINLARSLLKLMPEPATPISRQTIAQLLSTAQQQAQQIRYQRAESFALGTLGELYEQAGQPAEAQQVTEAALQLAQSIEAPDVVYLWQWQLGRVLQAQDKRTAAMVAYGDAIATLRLLRNDLVAINPEVQFSFREGVEPVYRQFVSLLLQPDGALPPQDLELARNTIEALQLAELDNFFREACLNAQPVPIDRIDQQAAVLYPIILPDRLELILSLPEDEIQRHTIAVPELEVNRTVTQLQAFLRQLTTNDRAIPLAEQVYDWLIRPILPDLERSHPATLVLVLDGVLRNIPMAVLHDRTNQQYLVEQYAIALTPGLQLLSSQSAGTGQFNVLLGGLSESPDPGFSDLPGVVNELEEIQEQVDGSQVLLNDQFSDLAIRDAIQEIPFPVVHLATHGEFSSRLDDTFILTWDDRITINQLNSLLQASDVSRRRPIELLVLSACETAEGDDRAALGLAGVSVRAGARSTVASLWPLDDQAAPQLMVAFYQNLKGNSTKAEALRQAQLALLRDPQYRQPYYWGAIVLVGNWQPL